MSIYGSMLQEYYVQKVRKTNAERNERLASLRTKAEAEAYAAEVCKKIAASFPLPKRKTPLSARITGTISGKGFRMEKVIYESRPGYPVTGNLYLPQGEGPFPTVLFLCGHSGNGKASNVYQTGAQGLALQGYAVFIIDPAGQGERWQFLDLPDANGVHGSCTREHNMAGKQLQLAGEFFGAWRAWDAIRGVDYLLTRKEVDPTRLGVTGNSGGGTMTTFVNALEPRFTMAAPSCYVTSWQRNLENELPADIEQIPPDILASGCEMGDFLIARAPRPVLILGQKNDFFDPRGTKETYESVRRFYKLLGCEDNVQLFIGPTNHGYSLDNREAMYKFFNLHAGIKASGKEPEAVAPFAEQETWCTPTGQIAREKGVKLIRDLAQEKAAELAGQRKKLTPEQLRKAAAKYLNLPRKQEVPYLRTLRGSQENSSLPSARRFSRFAVETEPGILAILKVVAPCGYFHVPEAGSALLYVPHLDAQSEMLQMTAPAEKLFCGIDVRGIGESMPETCDQYAPREFFALYGYDYHYASCGLMYGDPVLAGRVRDVLGAVAVLRDRGVKKLRLAGRGLGSIAAAFAALVCDDVTEVILYDALESYESIVRTPVTLWPQSVLLPGVLKDFDLPDVYAALKPKKLKIANYADAMLRK